MSKKTRAGYLVGSMEMIDKISKANGQIKMGLLKDYPDEKEIIFAYFGEMAESLSRLRIRLKQEENSPDKIAS